MDIYFILGFVVFFSSYHWSNCVTMNNCKHLKNNGHVTCVCRNVSLVSLADLCPKDITELNLNDNNFNTLQDNSFVMFENLRSLSIRRCNIDKIEVLAFSNLSGLEKLDIGNNFIKNTSLPIGVFQPLSALKYLNIGSNSFINYPDEQLSDLMNLEVLIINGVLREIFGKGFSALYNLRKLFLRPCAYDRLNSNTFENFQNVPLRHIELNCKIYKIEAFSFYPLRNLTSMKMSCCNKIKISNLIQSFVVFENHTMNTLDLNDNFNRVYTGFDDLTAKDGSILGGICLSHLDLGKNKIMRLQAGFVRNMIYKDCLQNISFAGNLIKGDFEMLFELPLLKNLTRLDISRQGYTHIESYLRENISKSFTTVRVPPKLQFANISLLDLKKTPFTSNFTVVNGENLHVLDMSYLNLISCRGTITGIPNLQTLNMSKSNCSDLSPRFFRGFPNLTHLRFRNAELSSVVQNESHRKLLFSMQSLIFIDFSENKLKFLTPDLLTRQKQVLKELVLDKNVFVDIPISFSEFPHLNSISLRQNKIEFISEDSRKDIDKAMKQGYNFTIYLENNPLKCICDSIDFVEWLFQTNAMFDENKDYPCLYTDGTQKSTFWVYQQRELIRAGCISQKVLYIAVTLTIVLVTLISVVSIIYKYKVPFIFWYYNIRRKYRLLKDMDNITKYEYDAFIAYHHSEGAFVKTKLVDFLERKKGLKVCVHQRDFIPGRYIGDNIMAAIKESRKVVILASSEYLRCKWGIFELDMSRMQMFQDNRDLIIIILLEQLSPSEMPESLKDIWERITCIDTNGSLCSNMDPSDDQHFWRRLYESVVS